MNIKVMAFKLKSSCYRKADDKKRENATTTISFDFGNKRKTRGKESSMQAGNLQIISTVDTLSDLTVISSNSGITLLLSSKEIEMLNVYSILGMINR